MVYMAYFTELICKFAITHQNDAFVAKVVYTHLTKIFILISFLPPTKGCQVLPPCAKPLTPGRKRREIFGEGNHFLAEEENFGEGKGGKYLGKENIIFCKGEEKQRRKILGIGDVRGRFLEKILPFF